MSSSNDLRFPSGHTSEQVKRNAKRLAKEKGLATHQALDQLVCAALGLPAGTIHWAEALQGLKRSQKCLGHLPEGYTIPKETRYCFNNGIIVALYVKDYANFTQTGPWISDEDLAALMIPTLFCFSAATGAQEDGRSTPSEEDWEYAFDDLFHFAIYRYTGESSDFTSAKEVVKDICKRNFFPPDHVWIRGQMGGWSPEDHPHVLYP